MGYRYCPSCGAEYRDGFEECSDCGVFLVDEPPTSGDEASRLAHERVEVVGRRPLTSVFVTGRRSEAEVMHSFLTSQGIESWIWSSGLSPWSAAASVTEMTGLANDFNAHRVMVEEQDADTAQALLATAQLAGSEDVIERGIGSDTEPRTSMQVLRSRWAVVSFALVLLLIVLLFGPPDY